MLWFCRQSHALGYCRCTKKCSCHNNRSTSIVKFPYKREINECIDLIENVKLYKKTLNMRLGYEIALPK